MKRFGRTMKRFVLTSAIPLAGIALSLLIWLTGHDSDVVEGHTSHGIIRYTHGGALLECVSCNPNEASTWEQTVRAVNALDVATESRLSCIKLDGRAAP